MSSAGPFHRNEYIPRARPAGTPAITDSTVTAAAIRRLFRTAGRTLISGLAIYRHDRIDHREGSRSGKSQR